MNTIKSIKFVASMLFILLLNINIAIAHCPLCTGAVGAAALGAKYFGIDATIIGVFIGAFAVSTGLWFARWLKAKFQRSIIYQSIIYQSPLIILISFALTVVPLMGVEQDLAYFPVMLFGSPGTLFNKAYWINKTLLGAILGAIATLLAYWLHLKTKEVKGKVLFPFQGIVFTLLSLAITSLIIFYAL